MSSRSTAAARSRGFVPGFPRSARRAASVGATPTECGKTNVSPKPTTSGFRVKRRRHQCCESAAASSASGAPVNSARAASSAASMPSAARRPASRPTSSCRALRSSALRGRRGNAEVCVAHRVAVARPSTAHGDGRAQPATSAARIPTAHPVAPHQAPLRPAPRSRCRLRSASRTVAPGAFHALTERKGGRNHRRRARGIVTGRGAVRNAACSGSVERRPSDRARTHRPGPQAGCGDSRRPPTLRWPVGAAASPHDLTRRRAHRFAKRPAVGGEGDEGSAVGCALRFGRAHSVTAATRPRYSGACRQVDTAVRNVAVRPGSTGSISACAFAAQLTIRQRPLEAAARGSTVSSTVVPSVRRTLTRARRARHLRVRFEPHPRRIAATSEATTSASSYCAVRPRRRANPSSRRARR